MPTVQSSPEVVRQIKSNINSTAKELRDAANRIKSALHASSEWNDAQGNQYRELMRQIARLIESPIDTLQAAQPKLEKLAQSLDTYNSVKF
jgi:hypothetical protein